MKSWDVSVTCCVVRSQAVVDHDTGLGRALQALEEKAAGGVDPALYCW